MAHDVFISYSSHDRAWAARLAADLKLRGVNCFFDQASLRDGAGWEAQIKAALMASTHIVCLWSKSAKESVWVGRELALFDVLHPAESAGGGLLLKLNLDDTPSAYSSLQQVRDDALLAAYAAAKTPWPSDAWSALVQRLKQAVKQDPNLLTVPVALLTLTLPEVAAIGAGELAKIAAELELDNAALAARYGPTRGEWKPFADSPQTIAQLLDSVKIDIDQRLDQRSVFFELTDDSFWADHDAAQAWVKGMKQRMIGAVIIDPVALSLVAVQTRLQLFAQVLAMENVVIIALHPQHASDRATKFRRWIKEFAVSVVQPYFDPPLAPDTAYSARCGIGLDDASEMRRLLQASIGQLLRRPAAAAQPASPIVGV